MGDGNHWCLGGNHGFCADAEIMSTMRHFAAIYRMYRERHSCAYSMRMAWNIAVRALPF
jgi:hypothetical protein